MEVQKILWIRKRLVVEGRCTLGRASGRDGSVWRGGGGLWEDESLGDGAVRRVEAERALFGTGRVVCEDRGSQRAMLSLSWRTICRTVQAIGLASTRR